MQEEKEEMPTPYEYLSLEKDRRTEEKLGSAGGTRLTCWLEVADWLTVRVPAIGQGGLPRRTNRWGRLDFNPDKGRRN